MAKGYKEWFRQSEYDFETAESLFKCGRYFYSVFMCHLSMEKALKGIYLKRKEKVPPKIHQLTYFLEKLELNPVENLSEIIFDLDSESIATRYPESLRKISSKYKKNNTRILLDNTNEVLNWLKEELKKS